MEFSNSFKWSSAEIEKSGTLWLWGANLNNYTLPEGQPLNGDGMAGSNGPTKGVSHRNYIGIQGIYNGDSGQALKGDKSS